jgi:hypothetical protein
MKNIRMNGVTGFCFICIVLAAALFLSAMKPGVDAQTAVGAQAVKTATNTQQKAGIVKPPVAQQALKPVTNVQQKTGMVKPPVVQKPEKPRIPTRELIKRLDTTNTTVLIEIIGTIGDQDSGSKYVQEAFAKLLTHKEEDVRQAVLDEAYHFDSLRGLLPALARCLYDPSETIRDDAIDVLSEIETREMIDILIHSLTNEYEDVRDNAEFYLFYHTPEMYTNTVTWFAWWKTNKTTFVFE